MKTAFERYIEANNTLTKCYEGVSFDTYKALAAPQQAEICKTERDTVQGFLKSNQIAFANIIQERLASAGHN